MRVAIVGSGGVARRHLGVLAPMANVQVVGHVSADLARAEAQAAEWGGDAFTDVDQLLNAARPDAVWICVTPDRHGALEEALIAHEVPFFVEKPLAVDVPLAESLAAHVAGAGLVTGVGYKFRALDTLARVRELLAETPARMVLMQWHDTMPPPAWWRHMSQSGGQVVEQATHLLDLARILVGEAEVVSASAGRLPRPDADVADVTVAHLQFGEVPGVLTTTCLLRGRQAIQVHLVCDGRVITISEHALSIETGAIREEVQNVSDPFAVENTAFLSAVLEHDVSKVLCDYADALQTHRLACAIRDTSLTTLSNHHPPAASSR